MKIVKNISELEEFISSKKEFKIGFVPTMGALHNGHLSLVRSAKEISDFVVVSIFVNPLQFNNKEDLSKYPRDIERDAEMLKTVNCDLLFVPEVQDVFPSDFNKVSVNLEGIDLVFEGAFREGHFDGVVQVLHRLFTLIHPTHVFFGLKDFQQCLVVKKLIETYFSEIQLNILPTIREESGLAMSSRNTRLSKEGIQNAAFISVSLNNAKDLFPSKSPKELMQYVVNQLKNKDLEFEYVVVVDAESLTEPSSWENHKKYIILTAVYIDGVRLIDNIFLN